MLHCRLRRQQDELRDHLSPGPAPGGRQNRQRLDDLPFPNNYRTQLARLRGRQLPHGARLRATRAAGRAHSAGTPAREPQGWIHLADQRYEARDTQYLLGKLADEKGDGSGAPWEPRGSPTAAARAWSWPSSRNRIRRPDGGFAPGRSPNGTPAGGVGAAQPRWPWSDLVDALMPNGRFLDSGCAARRGAATRSAS